MLRQDWGTCLLPVHVAPWLLRRCVMNAALHPNHPPKTPSPHLSQRIPASWRALCGRLLVRTVCHPLPNSLTHHHPAPEAHLVHSERQRVGQHLEAGWGDDFNIEYRLNGRWVEGKEVGGLGPVQ